MQLQKEVKSNPKQPSLRKSVWPQEDHCEKRCEIQGGGQLMAWWYANGKNFNSNHSGKFGAKS